MQHENGHVEIGRSDIERIDEVLRGIFVVVFVSHFRLVETVVVVIQRGRVFYRR